MDKNEQARSFMNALPDAGYDDLFEYFSKIPSLVSYHNPVAVHIYIEKVKVRHKMPDAEWILKFSEEGLLLCYWEINGGLFHLIAPRHPDAAQHLADRIKGMVREPVCMYAPYFVPDATRFKTIGEHRQVTYDCKYLVEAIEQDLASGSGIILNARAKTTLRRNLRECVFREVNRDDKNAVENIIEWWAKGNSLKRHAKINLFKAYRTLDWATEPDRYRILSYIGYRGDFPVSYSFFSKNPCNPLWVSQTITHSLNYSFQPGGHNSTSLWELYSCCKALLQQGIGRINASGYGSSEELKKFKYQFKADLPEIICFDYQAYKK